MRKVSQEIIVIHGVLERYATHIKQYNLVSFIQIIQLLNVNSSLD